jgi:phosphatidate cytidylyltransferase
VANPIVRSIVLILAMLAFILLWSGRHSLWWPILLGAGVAWCLLACLWLRYFAFAAAPTMENRVLKSAVSSLAIFPAWVAILSIHRSLPYGQYWALLALLIVWAADIGAYFSGRFLGKRKLAPRISPRKTWAGAWGALIAGILVAIIGGMLLKLHGGKLLSLAVLAALTSIAAIIGDLIESLMKRHAEVKDSGHVFPGHGGLLDRLDSVFTALPVFAAGKLLLGL